MHIYYIVDFLFENTYIYYISLIKPILQYDNMKFSVVLVMFTKYDLSIIITAKSHLQIIDYSYRCHFHIVDHSYR